jgi:DNA-binding response OmpR family regulator
MVDGFFRVLVVDDDKAIREVCAEALSLKGYGVTVASSAWDALSHVNGSSWDLVVTDVNMPGLSGVDFYRVAVSRAPELSSKFVFMSGNHSVAPAVEALGARLVIKPFRVKELLDAAWSVLKVSEVNRQFERLSLLNRLQVRINGVIGAVGADVDGIEAVAEDLSLNGMKIRYPGAPFAAGPGLMIKIEDLKLSREARVVWSAASDGAQSYSGVIFEKPVPAAILAGLASNRA